MKDYFGKDASALLDKKLYLFDMDGTIYRENELFDGVIELFRQIENAGGQYAFITNNPTKSAKDYVKKLKNMHVPHITEEHFFTSVQASVLIFKKKFGKKLVYAQGTRSFIKELKKSGLSVTEKYTDVANAILLAFDTEITGEKLRTTCKMLTKHDLPYYATNPDWVCPVDFGFIPDCGSMCASIARATGKQPIYIGKPEPTMIFAVMEKFGVRKEDTVVFGDRLYTDVASGLNAGVDTVCVLSGEVNLHDIEQSDIKPTFVLHSVKDLLCQE